MNQFASNLAEKLDALSPEQISTEDEFVEFLRVRGQDRALTQAAAASKRTCFRSSVE